jgi:hypothetical protein
LSNNGLLQPSPPEMNSQVGDSLLFFPHLHWLSYWKGDRALFFSFFPAWGLFHLAKVLNENMKLCPLICWHANFRSSQNLHQLALTSSKLAFMKHRVFACEGTFYFLKY